MSRARKTRKQTKLIARQILILEGHYRTSGDLQENISRDRFVEVSLPQMNPYEEIAQARHERRVLGHDIIECACGPGDFDNLIAWNQPGKLHMGYRGMDKKRGYDGNVYRKRILHRRKR